MPQICDMGQTALLPFRRKACWGIFRPKKSDGFGRVWTRELGWNEGHVTARVHKYLSDTCPVTSQSGTQISIRHMSCYVTVRYTNIYQTHVLFRSVWNRERFGQSCFSVFVYNLLLGRSKTWRVDGNYWKVEKLRFWFTVVSMIGEKVNVASRKNAETLLFTCKEVGLGVNSG
jgi:hypothetical protein